MTPHNLGTDHPPGTEQRRWFLAHSKDDGAMASYWAIALQSAFQQLEPHVQHLVVTGRDDYDAQRQILGGKAKDYFPRWIASVTGRMRWRADEWRFLGAIIPVPEEAWASFDGERFPVGRATYQILEGILATDRPCALWRCEVGTEPLVLHSILSVEQIRTAPGVEKSWKSWGYAVIERG